MIPKIQGIATANKGSNFEEGFRSHAREMSKDHITEMKTHVLLSIVIGAILLLFGASAKAQTPVALLPEPHPQFFLPNGTPNAGGCLFFFQSGTSTPQATYTDVTGTILNPNPVILDSSGYATVYLLNAEYRVQMWSQGGVNCATGTQIFQQDGVSAFQVVVGTNTIIFAGVTSDPVGQAGMVDFRTDLGRLRIFNSAWDSIPTDNSSDSFTNKTIDVTQNSLICDNANIAGQYLRNNGTSFACSVIPTGDLPANIDSNLNQITTNIAPGTVLNSLAKIVNGGVTETTTADVSGIMGVCTNLCGASGTPTILINGIAICNYDTAAVSLVGGDFVTNSQTVAGDCHDTGSAACPSPSLGQIIGKIVSSSNQSTWFLPGLCPGTFPQVVYSTAATAGNTSIGNTSMVASVAATATYAISGYIDQTILGASCAGNSTVQFNVVYTDPNAGSQTIGGVVLLTITTNGVVGLTNSANGTVTNGPATTFRAKSGTAILYSTTYTPNGACAPAPTVQLFPILTQLTGN